MGEPISVTELKAIKRFLGDPTPENYAQLFRILLPQVLTWFRVRGCTPAAAEDLAQEVMLAVFRSSHQLRDQALFRAWLFRVARNALLEYLQKQNKETELLTRCELDSVVGRESDHFAALESAQQFGQWMQALNEKEREVILLRYVDGHEFHEIADLLEIPAGTAQWRVFQSIRKLMARFGGAR